MIKWLLIAAAILAVLFGIWWYLDREKQKAAAEAGTFAAVPVTRPAAKPSTDETDWKARCERAERELAEARRGLGSGNSREQAIARGREISVRIMGEKRR